MKIRLFTIALILPVMLVCWSPISAGAGGSSAKTPEATLQVAFRAVLAGDFEAYLKTLHPEERETKTQRDHVRRYQWKRFRKSATRYLQEKRPDSFTIARRDSEKDHVVLFVQDRTQPERLPVPVRFRKAGDGWGIVMNSL